MNKERLTQKKKIVWCPPGRKRKGRPRNSWLQEVRTGMREKGIDSMEWIKREEWRRKIKTCVETLIFCI